MANDFSWGKELASSIADMIKIKSASGAAWLKSLSVSAAAWAWARYAPVYPYACVCAFLIMIDWWTAWNLRRRLARRHPERKDPGKISSAHVGKMIATLTRVNVALIAAAAVQSVILEGTELLSVDLLKLTAALICFRELLSILENESTASDSRWAGKLRKYLVDKARRHLDDIGR